MERLHHLQLVRLVTLLVVIVGLLTPVSAARTCGTSNYFNLGTTAGLQLTGDMTFLAWVRGTSAANGTVIQAYLNSGAFSGWGIRIVSTGIPQYWSEAIGTWQAATGDLDTGTWRPFGVTISGTGAGAGTHWRDGVTNGTWTHVAPGQHTGTKYLCATNAGADFLTYEIAEVAIWNVALTANEVAAYSQLGADVLNIRPANRVAYWPMWGIHSPEPDFGPNRYGASLGGTPARSTHPPVGLVSLTLGR
jgi:Concanavalin A-like lectin/glucanases superfamily